MPESGKKAIDLGVAIWAGLVAITGLGLGLAACGGGGRAADESEWITTHDPLSGRTYRCLVIDGTGIWCVGG